MNMFNRLSLRNKITGIIAVTILLVLAIGFGISFYQEINSLKDRLLSEKVLTAKIVSSYVVTDIIFEDEQAAQKSLSYLKTDESVLNAYLYDTEGRGIASLYEDSRRDNSLAIGEGAWHSFDGDELHVVEPVYVDDEKIGSLSLYITTSDYLKSIEKRIKYYLLFMVVLVVVGVVVASRLSRVVTTPILALANAAQSFSRNGSYDLSVPLKYEDETGHLVNAFNTMLLQLKEREEARNKAEQHLKRNEENLRLILDNLLDGVVMFDELGEILTVNKEAESLFGYTENKLVGKNISQLIPGAYSMDHDDYMRHVMEAREGLIIGGRDVVGLSSEGDSFPIRLSINELPHNVGETRRFIGSCHDITQLMLQEEQLNRSQKMDALGKLTGGIAHDYNNMLGIVMGFADLLKGSLKNQPDLVDYVDEIRHAGERGAKLTQKLLSFTRHKQSFDEQVDISAMLQSDQNMLEKTLTARIKIVMNLAGDLWPVWLDGNDLEDAVLNVSINAMHAMDGAGQLTFRTENRAIDDENAAALQLSVGDYVLFSVIDTGCGMDEATRLKIFDPFYSTKGDRGTGLGLSQVYGFVERSRGAIRVYSELGHGTRFTFYFPRYSDQQYAQEDDVSELVDIEGHEVILVVDDEPGLLALTTDALRRNGYTVISACSAKNALIILEDEHVDLMLSDVIMPEMDGYQLAEIVQKKYPDIKIQLASGFSDDRHKDMIDDDLHKQLIAKPYAINDLLKKLRMFLDA